MTDNPVPFGENRICRDALIAGRLGANGGEHPMCIEACSSFEKCRFESAAFANDYRTLKIRRKIAKLEAKLAELQAREVRT